MQFRKSVFTLFTIIFISAAFAVGTFAQTYAGEAAAAKVIVDTAATNAITTGVLATGPIASDGANTTLSTVGVSAVGGLISVGDSTVTSSAGALGGDVNTSQSSASVNTLGVSILGLGISADVVQSNTICTCGGAVCSGSSTITNLIVAGTPVVVDGSPNQTVDITVAGVANIHVVINEQIISPGAITVNALHITVTALATLVETDVIVAQAHSGITCAIIPLNSLYSGRAYGIWLRDDLLLASGVSVIVADTGFLPTSGGLTSVSTVGAGFPPILGSGTVTSNTSGGAPGGSGNTSQSDSSVEDLNITVPLGGLLPPLSITAGVLQSNTQCSCSSTTPTCSGNSILTDLHLEALGLIDLDVPISGFPNQHVEIPILGLIEVVLDINNRTSAGPGDITQEALRIGLQIAGVTDLEVVVASAHSDIVCGLSPSAAPISVSGRVLDPVGNALRNVIVSATGSNGQPVSVRTNMFGHYVFNDLEQGEIYVLSARHKQYRFASQVISSTEDVTGLDITALPENDRSSRR
jgi:hypothetical protein